jgi:hypothetical protein
MVGYRCRRLLVIGYEWSAELVAATIAVHSQR